MSDEINKEILKELKNINEKLDKLDNTKYVPPMKFIINCILVFAAVLFATLLFSMIPIFF
ncbi:hypothetical protein MM300_19065 [Evansella sp. LMS18]|uniref:hypothetical protein n=1 Tax=Evansella sp. LMS18 TaxID=2924033 RepID=UPI0020D0BB03|nr:hypothetical protein [Evansella sp. LMS18]UTR09958.1 hypothetical protein MM300_19065 [Evansella sp. LMS18]